MGSEHKKLSPIQKDLLLKKLNLNLAKASFRNAQEFHKLDTNTPHGFFFPIPNIQNVTLENYIAPPPAPGQIQIQAKAISLNFRDVMIGLGLYPKTEGIPLTMGGDYAGIVTACGEGVDTFHVGDEVIALYGGEVDIDLHFCSRVNVFTNQAAPKPAQLNFHEACCIPTVFLTAYYGIGYIGRLDESESILIHTASGGLGLAAIQIAKSCGATIFTTAGTEKKRNFLRSLGIEYVFDSQSLDFYDQILSITGGSGVDMILNTLPGPAFERGIHSLKRLGRFIQVDKSNSFIEKPSSKKIIDSSISLITIDLSQFFMNPKLSKIFFELISMFDSGILRPPTFQTFPHSEANQAISYMSKGIHIGKIVLDLEHGIC